MQSLKCGQCGSPDIEFLPGGFGRCRNCKTTYAPQGAHPAPMPPVPMPPVPVHVPQPFPQGSFPQPPAAAQGTAKPRPVALAVLGLLVAGALVLGGMYFVRRMAPTDAWSPPAQTGPVKTSPGTSANGKASSPDGKTVVEVTPPKVEAELRDVRSAVRHSVLVYVGRIVNTGETVIVRPSAVLSLFDATGKRVLEQPGYASDDWLEPGQWCPVTVSVVNAPQHERAEFKLAKPRARDYEVPPIILKLVEWGVTRQGDTDRITGTVRNESDKTVRFVKIIACGLDGEGLPVSDSYTFATEDEIAPGGESGFQVNTTSLRVGDAARYQVQCRAMAKD